MLKTFGEKYCHEFFIYLFFIPRRATDFILTVKISTRCYTTNSGLSKIRQQLFPSLKNTTITRTRRTKMQNYCSDFLTINILVKKIIPNEVLRQRMPMTVNAR